MLKSVITILVMWIGLIVCLQNRKKIALYTCNWWLITSDIRIGKLLTMNAICIKVQAFTV